MVGGEVQGTKTLVDDALPAQKVGSVGDDGREALVIKFRQELEAVSKNAVAPWRHLCRKLGLLDTAFGAAQF